MRITLLREIPDDLALRDQWNGLVQRLERPQVFFTYEWALAVQHAYGQKLHPLLFLAHDEAQALEGVAALSVDESGHVSFLCATTGDYCDFLSSPETKSEFVAVVLAELRRQGLREITLTNLPADSSTAPAIYGASRQNGYHAFARTAYHCAQVVLAHLERKPGETKPLLPRKKMLRRFLNAMGRDNPVRLDHARSWKDIEPILPQFAQAHVARFLATGRISNLARPERRVFLNELARLLSDTGSVVLTRMMSGENAFAWNYGFQYRGTWFWYQPTFDSQLEKYSPGFCLLAKVIEEAADDRTMQIVDLGLGAEEYKERFANETRETLYVTLRSSVRRHAREIVRHSAARVVKAAPHFEAGVRAGAVRVQDLSQSVRTRGAASMLGRLSGRLSAAIHSETEVCFYDWPADSTPELKGLALVPLDINRLASAASQYCDDKLTLTYLLRSAARLKEGRAEGFGLVDDSGSLLHFAWVTEFDGFFLSELNAKVVEPAPDCVMLFDCWTPVAARGHGYYGRTVSRIAQLMGERGKQPWIFSATANTSSVRGLEKAGFRRRYSLIRKRTLGWQRVLGEPPQASKPIVAEVSARV